MLGTGGVAKSAHKTRAQGDGYRVIMPVLEVDSWSWDGEPGSSGAMTKQANETAAFALLGLGPV